MRSPYRSLGSQGPGAGAGLPGDYLGQDENDDFDIDHAQ